ncbi:hypothetical protein O6H91_Y399300 [Diphasiastrum complanatum]|nr:hypothetical protein O6H91_Y399300 [Diphasiastrum complanatum]KAJ7268243.1 hypothetical protein O6H91_Y399300 [Diphasiastrum complanatum]KAJ7268244.1 hypothetical protein O6H91_Y399300 [Diphasiastrum complanatum]KAJ7268245.1 hypothetical protein O6H91_Y399300 [Diphasiastrum complanatum]KAJ7268246.1 hypothetical protein O6H91_Y399300 [Diphasiastrum complanatum]
MGEKGMKPTSSGATTADCCDMTVKCRCRWRWDTPGFCSKCHDKLQHRTCLLSSTFIFFLCSFAIFGGIGMLFAWLALSPFQHQIYASVTRGGCQPDSEGSWAIGIYRGPNPFALKALEMVDEHVDRSSAWPVANPVLTCASVLDESYPSNFVADPFLYLQGRKMYVFFETKNAMTSQGDIGVAESVDDGTTWQYLGIALDEEWHLSYPFVFEFDGQIYMMPEGSKNGDLRLYQALEFPLQWRLAKVLIHKPMVDATMLEYDGSFWIFGSDFHRFGAQKNGELEVWHAGNPLGPWKQHKRNPVHNGDKSMGARNGGRPFTHDGQLYRFGQDCGDTYGRRLRVFQVQTLTKDKYAETEVSLGFEESRKGRNAWNGMRYHHMDVQKSPTGDWVAVMDGDRVPSGDLSLRFYLGFMSLFVLILLNFFVGHTIGLLRCIFPSSRYLNPGKKTDTAATWIRPQLASRVYKSVLRLNRDNASFRHRLQPRTCLGVSCLVVCCILGLVSMCVMVRCFFGRNGADEPYPLQSQYSQFTLLTMTYDARLWNLKMYVKHYSRCASVREIVVVWNKGQPPNPLTEFDSAVPVRIRVEGKNSLNNRFKPDPQIKTRAVLELDDDIMVTCDDVERGFKAWRENPERIVGFYPRLIDGNPIEYRNERYARSKQGYNMILTGAAFVDSQVAFHKYWSAENEQGRALVDELFNCEDILLNFILSNSTSSRTVEYVHPSWAIDMSKFSSSAISRDTKTHYSKRTNCLLNFSGLYGGLPLKKWGFKTRIDGWDY